MTNSECNSDKERKKDRYTAMQKYHTRQENNDNDEKKINK